MNRAEEMKEFLQETKESLLKKRLVIIEDFCRKKGISKVEEIQAIVQGLLWNQREGCIVISYLYSSVITGSHEFFIAIYSGAPFVEEEPDGVYYSLNFCMQEAEEDVWLMNRVLKEKFVRVLNSEKEIIRRWYILQVYGKLAVIFKLILKDIKEESGIDIYFGSYMGETELI
ncbi:MAG: hypothetical protein K2P64_13855 [Lachnospiraceae bacterium]|nr:hypothetical protein [Lachnospiraceae bacterium]